MTMKSALKATIAATALGIGLVGAAAPAQAAELRCESSPGGSNYCRTNTSQGVTLHVQHSRYPCYQNDTWGYDRGGIWVANGCSATFRVGREEKDDNSAAAVGLGILALGIIGAIAANDDNNRNDYPPPPPPPPQQGYEQPYPPQNQYPGDQGYDPDDPYGDTLIVSCDSKGYKVRYCSAPVRNYAELVRQRSKSACRFNKTWGFDRRGVWVSKGCRADFAIY